MARKLRQKSLQDMVVQALDEHVPVAGNGRRKRQSKREAILNHLLRHARAGNPIALRYVLEFMRANFGGIRWL